MDRLAQVAIIILLNASFLEYWPSLGIMSAVTVLLLCALRFRKGLDELNGSYVSTPTV